MVNATAVFEYNCSVKESENVKNHNYGFTSKKPYQIVANQKSLEYKRQVTEACKDV